MNSSKTGLRFGEEQEEAHCSEVSFKARIARKHKTHRRRKKKRLNPENPKTHQEQIKQNRKTHVGKSKKKRKETNHRSIEAYIREARA